MGERELIERDVEGFLDRHQRKEILRLLTAGSVDDGKSTLIGRLLYDSSSIYDDQAEALRRDSAKKGDGPAIDYSLLVDGLLAEREQGITIDVAYRYFTTPARKFIIADTPGHEQYTRNMATGASTADVAILLIDARQGVLPQTRRHAAIASLLGIRHVIVAINKMDLVGWKAETFEAIRAALLEYAKGLGFESIQAIPLSALEGDNVVTKSRHTPYYDGPPLLEVLERVPLRGAERLAELRFPVQLVSRPNLDFRGFAGTIAAGTVTRGQAVRVFPSGRTTRVASIVTFEGELERASAPLSITLTLEDEVDVSRGDVIVDAAAAPEVSRAFEATVVWMHERPMRQGASYLLKHATRLVQASVTSLEHRLDVASLTEVPATELALNDIGRVTITAARPLVFDAYDTSRAMGAFVLIDRMTNATVGAGMIRRALAGDGASGAAGAKGHAARVTADERARRLGQRGVTVEVRGDEARAGALAVALERRLFDEGAFTLTIDARLGDARAREAATATALELGAVAIVVVAESGELEVRAAAAGAQSAAGSESDRVSLALGNAAIDLDAAVDRVVQRLKAAGLVR